MTTRFEDAASIAEKSEVEELERTYQLELREKSQIEELITRSLENPTDKSALMDVLAVQDKNKLLQMLQKLKTDGKTSVEFSVDSLIETINTMLNAVTDRSEAVENDTTDTSVERVASRNDVTPGDKKAAEKEYGDVTYADEKNKKYPIDTAEHIRAAWNYINQEKNAAKYSAEDAAAIKRKIIAAWKDKIDKAGPPSAQKSEIEKDGMDDGMSMDYKPLGGATSLVAAKAYLDAQKLEDGVYRLYSLFGACASNLMTDCMLDINQKLNGLTALLSEFQSSLTRDTLMTLSLAEKPASDVTESTVVKSTEELIDERLKPVLEKLDALLNTGNQRAASVETPVAEVTPNSVPATVEKIQPIVSDFSTKLAEAVALSGEARKVSMQEIINSMGQAFTAIDAELAAKEVSATPNAFGEAQVKSLIQPLEAGLNSLATQLNTLSDLVAKSLQAKSQTPVVQQPTRQEQPVSRAVTSVPQTFHPQTIQRKPTEGASIADIVKMTTVGVR